MRVDEYGKKWLEIGDHIEFVYEGEVVDGVITGTHEPSCVVEVDLGDDKGIRPVSATTVGAKLIAVSEMLARRARSWSS